MTWTLKRPNKTGGLLALNTWANSPCLRLVCGFRKVRAEALHPVGSRSSTGAATTLTAPATLRSRPAKRWLTVAQNYTGGGYAGFGACFHFAAVPFWNSGFWSHCHLSNPLVAWVGQQLANWTDGAEIQSTLNGFGGRGLALESLSWFHYPLNWDYGRLNLRVEVGGDKQMRAEGTLPLGCPKLAPQPSHV